MPGPACQCKIDVWHDAQMMAKPQEDCAKANASHQYIERHKKHNTTMLWGKSGQGEWCWDGSFQHCRANLNRWTRLKGNHAGLKQSQFCFCKQ